MGKADIGFLLAVCKAIFFPNTKVIVASSESSHQKTITFWNGSSINIMPSTGTKRGKRALLQPLYNPDGTTDHYINQEILDDILKQFTADNINQTH